MTSYVAPPSFYIYIEESFFVKALEKKEDRVRGLLGWCHFIFIDFSSACCQRDDKNGYLLQIGTEIHEIELIVLGTERFPNWFSIVCYLIHMRWDSNSWRSEPEFFICSKEWLSLQDNSLNSKSKI